MKLLGKLDGYTLVELIVGLMISALVLLYAATMGHFFSARHSNTTDGYLRTIDFITFKADFERSFIEANTIVASDTSVTFNYLKKEEVVYHFNNENLIRKQGVTIDTLEVKMLKFTYSLKPSTRLVESVSLALKVHKEYTFYFKKEYPANILVGHFMESRED